MTRHASRAVLLRTLPFTAASLAVAFLYIGGVFWNRSAAIRSAEARLRARAAQSLSPATASSNQVRIAQFYAVNGTVIRGDAMTVCYGVENASSIRLDPPVETLTPSLNRCFAVTPHRTTTYTLFAAGPAGQQTSASFKLEVTPPPPRILFVEINRTEVRRGEPFSLCYGVSNATDVRLEPLGWALPASQKNCRVFYPFRTTRFTLVVSGENGQTDHETFRLKVK